jgi:hypothetical protein
MDETARPSIAHIAAEAIEAAGSTAIYDYTQGCYVQFSTTVDGETVNVYDYSRGCYVSGTLSSLYDYGRGSYVQLEVASDGAFSGYDYASSHHFSGSVSGGAVSFYDNESGQYHNFQN